MTTPTSPPPAQPGKAFGDALADLPPATLAPDVGLVVRTQPAGAQLAIDGVNGPSPRTVRGPAGRLVTGRATLAGHHPQGFEARLGTTHALLVTLRPLARGTLRFRFLPAVGTRVALDGEPLEVGSNVVSIELVAGPHELVLSRENGERVTRRVEIVEGEVENLGTFELHAP